MSSKNRLGEELLGLELVAGKELTEIAGTLLDSSTRSGEIWADQANWLVSDYLAFFRDAANRPFQPEVCTELIDRRSTHIAEGYRATAELLNGELAPLGRLWSEFLTVVARDWQTPADSRVREDTG